MYRQNSNIIFKVTYCTGCLKKQINFSYIGQTIVKNKLHLKNTDG